VVCLTDIKVVCISPDFPQTYMETNWNIITTSFLVVFFSYGSEELGGWPTTNRSKGEDIFGFSSLQYTEVWPKYIV